VLFVLMVGLPAEASVGFGRSIAVGDFDNFTGLVSWDRDDMAVGAPWDDWGGVQTGSVTVYWRDHSDRSAWHVDYLDQNRLGGDLFVGGGDGGAEDFDRFGRTLAVGDFDGDGFEDLAIGTWEEDIGAVADAGCVHVLYGASSGPNGMPFRPNTAYLTRERIFPDVLPATPETGDWFGFSLAAGDFNGDGLDDLAVGAPGVSVNGQGAAGAVFLFYSAGSNFPSGSEWTMVEGEQFSPAGNPAAGDYFGYAVAAGNFDGDLDGSRPIEDLAIGAPGEDSYGETLAGNVFVYSGKTNMPLDDTNIFVADSGVQGQRASFGLSLVGADFNSSLSARFDDLAIGAPEVGYSGVVADGEVHVIYGGAGGFSPSSFRQTWSSASFGSACGAFTSPQSYGYFGLTLAAGDIINDPNGGCQGQGCNPKELVIGAPWRSAFGATNNGQVFVLRGINDPANHLAPVVGGNACLTGPSTAFANSGLYGLTVAVGALGSYSGQPIGSGPAADIVVGSAGIDKFSLRFGELTDVSSQSQVFDWPW
jgi:hypothetical protein